MHTHRIDFQPFDTIKFGPYLWTAPPPPPPYMPCTHIELISSHLTQSGLDCTLPLHAMHTHRIDFQQFDTIRSRFGPHPPPNAVHTYDWVPAIWRKKSGLDCTLLIGLIVSHLTQSDLGHTLPHIPCTHIRLISSHLTQADRFGTLSSPHMPSTHMGLISSHLTKSGLHRTLHHMPCTHRIHLQPFDKIRFGLYPPPCAMHTFHTFPAICWFPSLCCGRFFSAMILRFSSPDNSDF